MTTPAELCAALEEVLSGRVNDISVGDVIVDIINDVRDSFRLAMRTAGISADVVQSIDITVEDYLVNNYGDL